MHFSLIVYTFLKAGCLTKNFWRCRRRGLAYIAMGSLNVYGTTIRGCGVVDTIYQVVNSTFGSIHMGFFYSSNSVLLRVFLVIIYGMQSA